MGWGFAGIIIGLLIVMAGIVCGADPEGRGTQYFASGVLTGGAMVIGSLVYLLYRWLV